MDHGVSAPVVFLTGQRDHEIDLESMHAGAADYLVKGEISASLLERVIRYAIERKRAELALTESERRHQQLLGLIQEGIWAVDAEGVTTYVNPAMARMLGYDESDIMGKSFLDFIAEEYRPAARAGFERRRKGISEKRETQYVRKDGSILHALISTSPILDEQGRCAGAMALVMDVTEQQRLQEQLLHAQRLDSIGHLAGGVAHDFNNVLSVVIGYGEVMLGKLPVNSDLIPKVKAIIGAGERGAALARQLLIFGCKQKAEPRALNLRNLFADFEKMLRRLIGENIELNSHLPKDLWAIKADPTLMEQVIMNLAINARDAMTDGGSLSVRMQNVSHPRPLVLADATIPPGEFIQLSVSDCGCGIPEAIHRTIYEPFFTTKPAGKGTGLGLSVVYGIVKQAGGYISYESEVGKGTTFHIWLPRLEKEANGDLEVIPRGVPPMGQETILVVEDQPELLSMIGEALEGWGYQCLRAHDAEEALSRARRHKVNLLLTDLILPTVNGRQLAKQLREPTPDLKVIYMSGYQLAGETEASDVAEADGAVVLKKPFALPLLARTIREALDVPNEGDKTAQAVGSGG